MRFGIRGACASASLKRSAAASVTLSPSGYPRRMRLGLIEALPCLLKFAQALLYPRRMRLGLIEAAVRVGGCSLSANWVSEAHAPRPH